MSEFTLFQKQLSINVKYSVIKNAKKSLIKFIFNRALKRGVRMGLLQMENGRYRLANNMSKSLTNCRAPIQKKRRCACVPRRQNSRLRDYRKN